MNAPLILKTKKIKEIFALPTQPSKTSDVPQAQIVYFIVELPNTYFYFYITVFIMPVDTE